VDPPSGTTNRCPRGSTRKPEHRDGLSPSLGSDLGLSRAAYLWVRTSPWRFRAAPSEAFPHVAERTRLGVHPGVGHVDGGRSEALLRCCLTC
jgi:hypothetical protein